MSDLEVVLGSVTVTYGLDTDGDEAVVIEYGEDVKVMQALAMVAYAQVDLHQQASRGAIE